MKMYPKRSVEYNRINVIIEDITKNLYPSWCILGNIFSSIITYNLIIIS